MLLSWHAYKAGVQHKQRPQPKRQDGEAGVATTALQSRVRWATLGTPRLQRCSKYSAATVGTEGKLKQAPHV